MPCLGPRAPLHEAVGELVVPSTGRDPLGDSPPREENAMSSRSRACFAVPAIALLVVGAAPAGDPDPVVAWIQRTAYPLATCEPSDDQRDLAFLRELVGDAHIVALGEGTHGTSEFFKLKHRITRYLASEMGFTVFAIEANMPEAYRVNDYVQNGRGDPGALIDGMYFWTWNTHEVLDMIEWMRVFNASGRGRIQFTGFDMQTPDTAAAIARRALAKADPAAADSLDACMARLRRARSGRGPVPFANVSATLPVARFAGHHVRYGGWIRTQDLASTGFAGLWMRADAGARRGVAFDNMQSQRINGTRDWERFGFELDIPSDATALPFGVLMSGAGQAWFDSLRIDVDGAPWSGDALDLALEHEGMPTGFWSSTGTTFAAAMDDSVAHDGARSLHIRSIGRVPGPMEAYAAPSSPVEALAALLERALGERAAMAAATSPAEADWALQNLRVVEQCGRMLASDAGYTIRDSSMALNVDWILAHGKPGTKIVLWAHNAHVSRKEGWMGSHLARRHGRDMVVLGLATYSGSYTALAAVGGRLGSANVLAAPDSDAVERKAHESGLPRFVLDLRRAEADPAARRYFATPRPMRTIGAAVPAQQFHTDDIARLYDAIVYVDSTSATRLRHPPN
jgi:erythromycin esterase-like protein